MVSRWCSALREESGRLGHPAKPLMQIFNPGHCGREKIKLVGNREMLAAGGAHRGSKLAGVAREGGRQAGA